MLAQLFMYIFVIVMSAIALAPALAEIYTKVLVRAKERTRE